MPIRIYPKDSEFVDCELLLSSSNLYICRTLSIIEVLIHFLSDEIVKNIVMLKLI